MQHMKRQLSSRECFVQLWFYTAMLFVLLLFQKQKNHFEFLKYLSILQSNLQVSCTQTQITKCVLLWGIRCTPRDMRRVPSPTIFSCFCSTFKSSVENILKNADAAFAGVGYIQVGCFCIGSHQLNAILTIRVRDIDSCSS